MKSFDQWTADLSQPKAPKDWKDWQFWEDQDCGFLSEKGFMIRCCCCDKDFAISKFIGADEFDPDASETFHCGRSDRCCP